MWAGRGGIRPNEPDLPVRHENLLCSIWGPLYCNEREYLPVVVNQLRKKIEDDPARPVHTETTSATVFARIADLKDCFSQCDESVRLLLTSSRHRTGIVGGCCP